MSLITKLAETRSEDQRRSNLRYPIAANLTYQLVAADRRLGTGNGRSVNLSSRGILLAIDTVLPVGVPIELQIEWPVKPDHQFALSWHAQGRTLRSDGKHTAVAIMRSEFRAGRQAVTGVAPGAAPLEST